MKDIRAVRFNEKVKRVSTLLGGGGLALLLTAFTRWADGQGAFSAGAWILTGIMFMFMSVQINDLLDSEDTE